MLLTSTNIKYIFCLAICINISACNETKTATTYTVKKESYSTIPTWSKPINWKISPITHISQLAVFNAEGAKASLSMLQGNGGGITANVNRWGRQLGLQAETQQQINARSKKIGNWVLIKLKNKQQATFGAIYQTKTSTIFAKLSGDIEILNNQAEIFLQFISSIKFGDKHE